MFTVCRVLCLAVFLFMTGCSSGSSRPIPGTDSDKGAMPAKDSIKTPIAPSVYQKMLDTGMDVDWVKTDAGREAAQRSYEQGVDVPKIFKKRGLSHVRMRVKEDVLMDLTLLDEIKHLVDQSIDAGLIPIIAYQAAEFKDDPTSDETLNHVKKWWQKVSETFKEYPYSLAYDLIIETTGEVKKHNDRLNLLYRKVTDAIRAIDSKRILIIAPNKISSPYELDNLEVPQPTDFMMVEWHFYAAGPQKDNPKKQWTTGTLEDKRRITDKIDYADNWSKEHKIPTWVGAWMANNYNDVNRTDTLSDGAPSGGEYSIEEQKVFARFMSERLHAKGIAFAVNSDTKFYNREMNEWYPSMAEVLDIIIGKR